MSDSNNSFVIEEISLDLDLFKEPFYVCNIQLRTPFWSEVFRGSNDNNNYIGWNKESLEKRKKKIINILDEIKRLYIDHNINLRFIVFPEYSVESCMIPFLESFSKNNNVVVIAGDYDQRYRNSYACVIYPHNGGVAIAKQFKLSPSRFDEKYLSPVADADRRIIRFTLSDGIDGESVNIMTVFMCYDFLEYTCPTIDRNRSGLYIALMCSPRIDEFYGLSYFIIRSIKGHKSNVILLCNSADNPPNKKSLNKYGSCGETQIVSPSENKLPKLGRFSEGGILAKINLNTANLKPTTFEHTPVIDCVKLFALNEKGFIRESENNSSNTHIVINPNAVLQLLGLQRIYALYCIKSYARVLSAFQYVPMQSNGVFGIYDILIRSYEENMDFFERRLSCHLGDKYNDLRDDDLPTRKVYSVRYVVKYRGKDLCKIESGDIKSLDDFSGLEAFYIENNISDIKNKMRDMNIGQKKEEELVNKSIFLQVTCDSDLYPEDKERGYEEYLVFIDLYPTGDKNINLVNKEFRKSILPALIDDDKIRTIEICGDHQNSESLYDGSYIIHLIGSLIDVRNVIINSIHEEARSFNIRCRTFVVPAAEPLSSDKHIYLDETILRDPQLQRFVSEMIPFLKYVDPTNPFIIKQVPLDVIKKIYSMNSSYRNFVEYHSARSLLLNKFNHFIYGICFGCKNKDAVNKLIYADIKGWCAETYFSVTDKIEVYLNQEKIAISKRVCELKSDNKNVYESKKIGKNKIIKDVLYSDQSIMGDLLSVVLCWHEMFNTDGNKIISDLKGLQQVVSYRNIFSHSYRNSLSNQSTYIFSVQLIDAFVYSLSFHESYCSE